MANHFVESVLKKTSLSLALAVGLFSLAPNTYAAPVQYVQLCDNLPANLSLGPGFYYVPGFEASTLPGNYICSNPASGVIVQSIQVSPTSSVIWKSLLPYPEGEWVSDPQQACGQGTLVNVGSFKSTDFALTPFQKLQTKPFTLQLNSTQLITKTIMKGGFYDPRVPSRMAVNGSFLDGGPGLCLRSMDPTVSEKQPTGGPVNPPYGNGGLPMGCVADRRIANVPLGYAISATAAYPEVDAYFVSADSKPPVGGPYVYGKQLVVTTDIGPGGPGELTYCDPTQGSCGGGVYNPTTRTYSPLGGGQKPMAGTLSVWVCVSGS